MSLLLFILIILGIVWLVDRGSGNRPSSSASVDDLLAQRNQEWAAFITRYHKTAKTKAEHALLDRMLADIAAQGLPVPQDITPDTVRDGFAYQPVQTTAPPASQTMPAEAVSQPTSPQIQLDNTSLLLYFGAFLFVASVGLFISFGGASGTLRALAVVAVAAIFYGSGLWLQRNRPVLRQAAITFAGIGLVTAPLAGLAVYAYVFDQQYGPLVWFVTSLVCLGLYFHALKTLRHPLLSYVLIFTFLSLFESGVSVLSAPVYYFGWGMAAVAIGLLAIRQWQGYDVDLRESSAVSARLLLPLSLLVSLALVSSAGAVQAGVSLLLAAAYYGLEFREATGEYRDTYALISQISANVAVAALLYGWRQQPELVAIGLLAAVLLQLSVVLTSSSLSRRWQNFVSILLVVTVVAAVLGSSSGPILLAAVGLLLVVAVIAWLGQNRADGYVAAIIAWTLLPLIWGQAVLVPHLTSMPQVSLLLMVLAAQVLLFLVLAGKRSDPEWLQTARISLVVTSLAVALATIACGVWGCLIYAYLIVGLLVLLSERDRTEPSWPVAAGLVMYLPILWSVDNHTAFLITVGLALALQVVAALRYRTEFYRWSSTLLWLLLPLAVGQHPQTQWGATSYAYAYLVVTICLLVARAIARGVVGVSNRIPLAAYARSASYSYVVGYVGAALLAVSISLVAPDSRLHTSLIVGTLTALLLVVSGRIERRTELVALIPALLQLELWSVIRPGSAGPSLTLFLTLSSLLALASYLGTQVLRLDQAVTKSVSQVALLAGMVTPVSGLLLGKTDAMMPIGLIVLACMLLDYFRAASQSTLEWIGSLVTLAVLWLLVYAGVHVVQAYVHIIVLNLALYAYWRALRQEREQSDNYLWAMLAAATVPLVLQALAGQAGGLYGWWLLLEQVGFMLLGIALGRRFITLWGLYVAVGAVLYQLRNLGWAALTVLALFLIGLAVYQLQRSDRTSQN